MAQRPAQLDGPRRRHRAHQGPRHRVRARRRCWRPSCRCPLALWLGHRRRGATVGVVVANTTRALPTLALLTLLAASGLFGNTATVLACAVFAVPPLLTNTVTGLGDVDADVRDAARGVGMSGARSPVGGRGPARHPADRGRPADGVRAGGRHGAARGARRRSEPRLDRRRGLRPPELRAGARGRPARRGALPDRRGPAGPRPALVSTPAGPALARPPDRRHRHDADGPAGHRRVAEPVTSGSNGPSPSS